MLHCGNAVLIVQDQKYPQLLCHAKQKVQQKQKGLQQLLQAFDVNGIPWLSLLRALSGGEMSLLLLDQVETARCFRGILPIYSNRLYFS